MEPKTLYKCTGSCGGVTDDSSITGCGLDGCEKFGQPLQAVTQCEGCCSATEADSTLHVCDACPAA